MLSRRVKSILVLSVTIPVLGLLFMVSKARPPKKPESVPLGDYSVAVQYAKKRIEWSMKQYHLPSVAVSLIDDQDTVWQETMGMANLEQDIPAEPDTVYKVWSVAKAVTALEIMQLVEEGVVDLDTPISTYLPDFSIHSRFPDSDPITIRSILTHRSGLPRNECHWIDLNQDTLTRLATSVKDCYQTFPVGYRFKYSNIGFDLLGHLIQEMRGEPFPDTMRQKLLLPIGMKSSAFLRAQVPGNLALASGYEYYQGDQYPYDQGDSTSLPSGNLYTTIEDMGQLAKFIFNNGEAGGEQIIGADIIEEMLADQPSDVRDPQPMGLGWKKARVLGSERMAWHDGGPSDGTGALVALLPARKLGVILFANGTAFEGIVSVPLALDILELMLAAKNGVEVPPEAGEEPVELDQARLEQFAGNYAAFGDIVNVSVDGNRLEASMQGITFRLVPVSGTSFRLKHWLIDLGLTGLFRIPGDLRQMRIDFMVGDEGDDDIMIIGMGGFLYEISPRYPHFETIPSLWQDLSGEYDLMPRMPSGAVGTEPVGETSIGIEDGVLRVSGAVGPVLPISDSEIIIMTGPFAGETMRYEPGTGDLTHQSFLYRRRS